MSQKEFFNSTLIPTSSDEALWEWDLGSDKIFFSDGAKRFLHISPPPEKMRDFLELVHPENLPDLIESRSKVIRGEFRGVAESDYICNEQPVHEHLFTLARNSIGFATRLMARLSNPEDVQAPISVNHHTGEISRTGVWIFHVATGKIWQDAICANILGFPENEDFPIEVRDALSKIHFSEKAAFERHYKLFIKGDLGKDTITDFVRVGEIPGQYTQVLVRASCMERDEEGKAILITGLITPAHPENIEDAPDRDDRLFNALNSMGVGQWNWEAEDEQIWYCRRYLAILGYPEKDIDTFRHHWHLLVHPDDLSKIERVRKALIESPASGDTFECTYRMKDAKGSWVWIFDRGCVTWRDAQGKAGHMVGSITNITTAQTERDRLEELVRNDALTGLCSRAFCNLEIEHIEQNKIRPVSAISMDVTGLKMINDSLGHAGGDKLLTVASSILRGALRASDLIARTGGDEFLVILSNCDYGKGQKILNKIQLAFDAYNADPTNMPVLVSMGLGSATDMSESVIEILDKADQDMYAKKRASKQYDHALIRSWIKANTGKDVVQDDRIHS